MNGSLVLLSHYLGMVLRRLFFAHTSSHQLAATSCFRSARILHWQGIFIHMAWRYSLQALSVVSDRKACWLVESNFTTRRCADANAAKSTAQPGNSTVIRTLFMDR